MKHFVKSIVEQATANRVWIEPSVDLDELLKFVRSLSPRPIPYPLIRVGPDGDGGYLLPDDLKGVAVCVSPGVSTEVGFDLDVADRGMEVFMADASVDGPPVDNRKFHFTKQFIDVFEDADNTRLDKLCQAIPSEFSGDRILQMDIEGAEYRVLLDTSDETLSSFRIIAIEFHFLTDLFGRFSSQMIIATFRKLLKHFDIVHIHPNNVRGPTKKGKVSIAPVMEFTLLRKDRIIGAPDHGVTIPHKLDSDNVTSLPSVILPECWR